MKKQAGPGSRAGMTRRVPRWTIAFLRALERTGKVRWAAEDAGVDFTTAYERRKAHAEFGAAWEAALERGRAAREAARAEDLGETVETLASSTPPPPSVVPLPTASGGREELTIANGQLRRVGAGRWSKAKEQVFLAELATHGSVRRACKRIGLSTQAVDRRRRTDAALDAACKAAREIGRERLADWLVEAGNATFDPADVPPGEELELPKVSVAEAIQIARLGSGKAAPAGPQGYDVADVAERFAAKLAAIRDARLREGWQLDAAWQCLVPPGWVQCGGAEP